MLNLATRLLNPLVYKHETHDIEVIETHMSWVLLTGEYAYKVKKPVKFDFVDFSTLPRRHFYCREELRLNKRFSGDLYIAVVPICESVDGDVLVDPDDPKSHRVVDWAVKMHQFDIAQSAVSLLDCPENHKPLGPDDFYKFGDGLAVQHGQLPRHDGSFAPSAPVLENLVSLQAQLRDEVSVTQFEKLNVAVRDQLQHLSADLLNRQHHGFVRECHGDLHLGNLMRHQDALAAFDCLEFDPALRHIDVWADVAFLFMDLSVRNQAACAYAFVDGYLNRSGDYDGATLLAFYACYRALVRAKVELLREHQQTGASTSNDRTLSAQTYIDWAWQQTSRPVGNVIITSGLSGSGKSYWAGKLLKRFGLLRIRSDVLRKTEAGMATSARSGSDVGGGIYADVNTDSVYRTMAKMTESLVTTGESVIVDATFLRAEQRKIFRALAKRCEAKLVLIEFEAPEAVLTERIRKRALERRDASEADTKVLAWQQTTRQTITEQEEPIRFDTVAGTFEGLVESIKTRLHSH